jgi:hypothetical protein
VFIKYQFLSKVKLFRSLTPKKWFMATLQFFSEMEMSIRNRPKVMNMAPKMTFSASVMKASPATRYEISIIYWPSKS